MKTVFFYIWLLNFFTLLLDLPEKHLYLWSVVFTYDCNLFIFFFADSLPYNISPIILELIILSKYSKLFKLCGETVFILQYILQKNKISQCHFFFFPISYSPSSPDDLGTYFWKSYSRMSAWGDFVGELKINQFDAHICI